MTTGKASMAINATQCSDFKKPHSKDLRKGRASIPGQVYLVTTVTAERKPLFADLFKGRIVVNALRHQEIAGNVQSLAFVLMPDHLHWLLELKNRKGLSAVIAVVKSFSAREINQKAGTSGQIWQSGFHDHAVRTEVDLKSLARYVVANPLRAGIVKRIGDYPLWDAVWL